MKFLVPFGQIHQSVTLSESGVHLMTFYGKADDPDCRFLHCLGGTCYNSPMNTTDWINVGMGDNYAAGD